VQDRRRGKRVPGGRLLHDYVNLYMTARNPMLSKLLYEGSADEVCVIRVSTDVLDLPDVVVSDMNAAAFGARFLTSPGGLEQVNSDRVFRRYWKDGDTLEQERCKKAKCAEVLVPDQVEPLHLLGVRVGTPAARARIRGEDLPLAVTVDADLFFNP
jgi:hypothetical protein